MKLKQITNSSAPEVETLIALHRATFPEYERYVNSPLLQHMIDHEQSMSFNAVYENDELAGYFIYWYLGSCYYVHFIAVFPEMRNKKIGQQLLDWISANLHRPVFLEAEIPYDDITARRLNFYKRNGYQELAEDPKMLAENRDGHPLWLMGNQRVEDLDSYLVKIKEGVYLATER